MHTVPLLSQLRKVSLASILCLTLALAACEGENKTPEEVGGTPTLPANLPTVASSPTAGEQPTTPPQPTPQLTGDGEIRLEGLYHHSRDPQYREPGGSVTAGTQVKLRLKTDPGDLTGAHIRLWNSTTQTETLVPMSPVAPDMWEATLTTPLQGAALWYRFVATDGTAVAWYNDDRDRDGGMGEGKGYESDEDYVIVAYRQGFDTPDWLEHGVVYQIFPDRFYNSDPANDKPEGSFIYGGATQKRQWGDKPTGGDDFFGGDLKGITAKLDYLQSLGVTAIYLNPIFASPSNHRYDTTDYSIVDPALGDLGALRELITEGKERGISLILDGVFNHASSDSLYFDKFARYDPTGAHESQSSDYYDWFTFSEWPEKYRSWQNIDTLPVYVESDEVKDFLFRGPDSVAQRWMKEGTGGWRLDAAEQKSHAYWRDFRTAVKGLDPDAVIIGEFWHNSAPWLSGDQWDGTMNYRFRDAVLGWLANPIRSVETMVKKLDSIREDYPPQALATSMNLIGTHDTARALTEAGGDKAMLRAMALLQFTWPGLATVYYGDEAGLEGGRDPDDRRTYPWGSEDAALIDYYRTLGKARKEVSALRGGEYVNLFYDNALDVYAYARKDDNGVALIALTRSEEPRQFDVPLAGVLPDGATLEDRLKPGTTYTVQGGRLQLTLEGKGAVLLVSK
jgi:glycosidase